MAIPIQCDIGLGHPQRLSDFVQGGQPCTLCSSRLGGIFSDLDPSCLLKLDQLRQTVIYPSGTVVFMEGDPPRVAYCVCSGRLKLSIGSLDGRAAIVGIAVSGDILGVRPLLLERFQDLTATTIEPTQLCFIPKEGFLGFLRQNENVSLRLAQKLSAELEEAYRKISGAVLDPPIKRLMELLLALCQTHGQHTQQGITLKTNLCQDELAELVGVSRRSLNRALAKLRRQGLIECRHRSILIRDWIALVNRLCSSGGF